MAALRAVYIQTNPPTKSLAESRQILSSLQKFGKVVTFRNLRYDVTNKAYHKTTNNILAIFESPQSASRAIESSPITIPISLPRSSKQGKPADKNRKQPPIPQPNKPHLHPWPIPSSLDAASPRELRFTIQPSTHNHDRAPFFNPFSSHFIPDETSFQYGDLTRRDPDGRAGGLPVQAAAVGDCLMGRKGRMPGYLRRKVEGENARMGAFSLWGVYQRENDGREVRGEDEVQEVDRNG